MVLITFKVLIKIVISYNFQVKLSEKSSLIETAEGKIAELTAKVNEQQKLIQKLEDDILKVWLIINCFHSANPHSLSPPFLFVLISFGCIAGIKFQRPKRQSFWWVGFIRGWRDWSIRGKTLISLATLQVKFIKCVFSFQLEQSSIVSFM